MISSLIQIEHGQEDLRTASFFGSLHKTYLQPARSEPVGSELKVILIGTIVSSGEATTLLAKRGYEAAGAAELFTYLESTSLDKLDRCTIALGSIFKDQHGRSRVMLAAKCDERVAVKFGWFDEFWASNVQFLCRRLAPPATSSP